MGFAQPLRDLSVIVHLAWAQFKRVSAAGKTQHDSLPLDYNYDISEADVMKEGRELRRHDVI